MPTNGPEILRGALHNTHEMMLTAGLIGVLSVLAGLVSRRVGAPILLVFLGLGVLAGEDGVLGFPYDDFARSYLIGSVALAIILFQGGLNTPYAELREVFWPSAALATLGVLMTTAIIGGSIFLIEHVNLKAALLVGAIVAPTDAAAVALLLRGSGAILPKRLMAVLEVESGLNDPMSVFLTFTLLRMVAGVGTFTIEHAVLEFLKEMAGGAAIGVGGGFLIGAALKRLPIEPALATVLALTGALSVFGLAQLLGTSGFLATYLAGVVAGAADPQVRNSLKHFFDGMGWLSQIVLFVMLGLLVTPHGLPPFIPQALAGAAVLILVARPIAVLACMLPFGFSLRESAFASYVGLRGAVPIYLSLIPGLADPIRDTKLFAVVFIVVVTSLLVQGWTVAPAARLLGYKSQSVKR